MNKTVIVSTAVGAIAATAVGSLANFGMFESKPQFAEVLNVKPITETTKTPRQECKEVAVTHQRPAQDEHKLTGAVLGAIVGGVVGKQFGGGNGKKLATAAGAAAGGFAGRKIQEDMQDKDTYTTVEQRCKTIFDEKENVIGYTVKYQLDGTTDSIRMDYNPGKQIPVVDGKLVLDKTAKPSI